MKTITKFNNENFIDALKAFFTELNVPVNYVADEPLSAKDILKDSYHNNNTFNLIDEVYTLGIIDDAAFEGNKSLAVEKIKSDYDGIIIFGVILKKREKNLLPTRSQLAEISRAFNREFYYTPVSLVFKYANDNKQYIAFANTQRLKYKQEWREGEKAGKVSLLRDIDIQHPHRGHEDIIKQLRIQTSGVKAIDTFAKLYAYWQEVFSVSVLNKRFYQELSNWYFWAVKQVTFPSKPTELDAIKKNAKLDDLIHEHNATNVIRLLTRLLFTWFIKEKKLIPEELFDLEVLQKDILNKILPYHENGLFNHANKESVYFRAILQNLFFASLNCPINSDGTDSRKRGFRGDGYGTHRGIDYFMRYKRYFKNPDAFLELINTKVPFLNGGLFECLDDKYSNIYIDGFSDQMTKGEQLIVPDYLFFGTPEEVDLSNEYGVNNSTTKKAAVKGLINILKSYKFTITENTPIEEDVALDPELLGKVFENLLASYNPETKTTARKQTGSFYTPREIVNYMVDESLIAYLKNSLTDWEMDEKQVDEKLHQLASFDANNPFAENQKLTQDIVSALDRCKILDPACGSGAFPMGVLQKMVHMLQKLDPNNLIWKEVQILKVQEETSEVFKTIDDKAEREEKLKEINNAFDQRVNDPDYARKLYLIENCIYGVDIQPIATQISKLRFFISLVVDQKSNSNADENFGIRPLPNLETKFVTANTLIGINKEANLFTTDKVKDLEKQLKHIRHKLFSARTKDTKLKYRQKDEELRKTISNELKKYGLPVDSAEKLAKWDPYNQNSSSQFFDQEWMFDITNGFDIVIGNPPFVLLQERIKEEVDFVQIKKDFKVASYKVDLYHLFYEKGIKLLSTNGILTLISPTNFLLNNYTSELRKLLLESNLSKVLLIRNSVFEASVDTSVFTVIKNKTIASEFVTFYNGLIENEKLQKTIKSKIKRDTFISKGFIINPEFDSETSEIIKLFNFEQNLGKIATVNFGMQLRNRNIYPEDVIHDKSPKNLTKFHKKCYTGRDIKEYQVVFDNRYCYFNKVAQSGGCWDEKTQLSKNKILVPQIGKYPTGGIDIFGYPVLNTAFLIVPFDSKASYSILAIINSKIIRYFWLKKFYDQRQTFPKIKGTYLKEIPIPKDYLNNSLIYLSKMIAHNDILRNSLLRDVLESLIIELYLSKYIKEKQLDILKFVERDIEKVMQSREFEKLSDTEKEQVIEQLHNIWSHPVSEVRNRIKLFAVRSPEILKPILES